MKKNNKNLNILIKRNLISLAKQHNISRINPEAVSQINSETLKFLSSLLKELKQEIAIQGRKTLKKQDVASIRLKTSKNQNLPASFEI